jgi:hypothetical protein
VGDRAGAVNAGVKVMAFHRIFPSVLRLVGLPHVARYPVAVVQLREDALEILFHGPDRATRIDVPLQRIGAGEDLESIELGALAQLQALGYEVKRGDARGGEAGS